MDDDFDEFGNFVGPEYSDSNTSSVSEFDEEVEVVHNEFDELNASVPLVRRRESKSVVANSKPENYDFQRGLQSVSGLQRFFAIKGETNYGKTALLNWLAPKSAVDTKLEPRLLTMQPKLAAAVHQLSSTKSVMLNLVDSPGHEDFVAERLLSERSCDGSVLVVDCVEGTANCLKLAPYNLVVLTKFDRLMFELKLPAKQAFERLDFLVTRELNASWDQIVITSAKFRFSFSLNSIAELYRKYRCAEVDVSTNIAGLVIDPIFKLMGFALIGEQSQPALSSLGIFLTKEEWNFEADRRIRLVMQLYLERPLTALVDKVCNAIPDPQMRAIKSPIFSSEYLGLQNSLWWGRNGADRLEIDGYVFSDAGLVSSHVCEPYNWFCTSSMIPNIPLVDLEPIIDQSRLLYVALEPLQASPEASSQLESQLRQITAEFRGCKLYTLESREFMITAPGEMYIDHCLNKISEVAYRVSQPLAVLHETVSAETKFAFSTKSWDHKFSVSISAEPVPPPDSEVNDSTDLQLWSQLARNCWVYGPSCDASLQSRILEGIESCCECGPLIEAPLMAVKFTVADIEETDATFQVSSTSRRAAYSAVLLADPRLLEPEMRVSVVGKLDAGKAVYSQLEKRGGQVVVDTPIYGTNLYLTEAVIPLMDSFALTLDILCHVDQRCDATVRFRFSQWITVSGDPLDQNCSVMRKQPAEPAARARDFLVKIRRRRNLAYEPDLQKYVDARVLQVIQNYSGA